MENIDYEKLRNDLINYFMAAAYNVNPVAMSEVTKIKKANYLELIKIAVDNGFTIEKYIYGRSRK